MFGIRGVKYRLARWLVPEVYAELDRLEYLAGCLMDCERLIGAEVPEVRQVSEWVIGRSFIVMTDNEWQDRHANTMQHYGLARQFPSLSKFRDVIVNEYRRKIHR
jgi:hypothetical protein